MIKSYLLVTLRNMMRNKTISLINIVGFGLGIAAFLFVTQMTAIEYSFDEFHKNKETIYRVESDVVWPNGVSVRTAGIEPALGPLLKEGIPEIRYAARFIPQLMEEPYCVVSHVDTAGNKKSFNEQHAWYADPDFLNIFKFDVILGNPAPLTGSSGLVMTRTCARKYFGDESPIGKVLELTTGSTESKKTRFTYQVEAIVDDLPANSTLQFEILLPFSAFEDNYQIDVRSNWIWHGCFYTFIEVNDPKADTELLESKLYQAVPEQVRSNWLDTGAKGVSYHLNQFQNLHFDYYTQHPYESALLQVTDKRYLFILVLIGLSILVIAQMNYISLATAKAIKRVREISVRKLVGAGRKQLAGQFLLDAWLNVMVGFGFSLTLLQVSKPMLSDWLGLHVPQVTKWNLPSAMLVTAFIVSVVLMSLVPAYYLSRIAPVSALRGRIIMGKGAVVLRKFLVVMQFGASVTLICLTYVIVTQLSFLRGRDSGMDMDYRISIHAVGTEDMDFMKFRRFKEKVKQLKPVVEVSAGTSIPGYFGIGGPYWSTTDEPQQSDFVRLTQVSVDYDYLKTFNVPVLAGREFTEDVAMGGRVALINERAMEEIGISSAQDALGKSIYFHWVNEKREVKIIGVVPNLSLGSPGKRLEPLVFTFANTTHPYPKYRYYVVHLASDQTHGALKKIEGIWAEVFDNAPFNYEFLEQSYARVFEQEEKLQSVATLSTLLAIFIACMGLGALVAYSVEQRTKEIGIRKTLGSSLFRLLYLLSKDFVILLLISAVLSVPFVLYGANAYLTQYEYRIEITVWHFIVPCMTLVLIALITMSYQTVRAANGNPVEALKHE